MIIHSPKRYGRDAVRRIDQTLTHGVDGARALVESFTTPSISATWTCFPKYGRTMN